MNGNFNKKTNEINEKRGSTLGQVSVPQAMADMAYSVKQCHINDYLIISTSTQT